jgi:ribulose kinase
VGMIGLGTIHPHQICLITGSSHLHCLITPSATSAPGTWGAYRGAPLPHLNFAEGGQSSTGSLVRWVRDLISSSNGYGEKVSYEVLDEEASLVAPGCDGLVALETW